MYHVLLHATWLPRDLLLLTYMSVYIVLQVLIHVPSRLLR